MRHLIAYVTMVLPLGAVTLLLSALGSPFTFANEGVLGTIAASFVLYWVGFLQSRIARAFDAKLFAGALASPRDQAVLRVLLFLPWLVFPAFVVIVGADFDPWPVLSYALSALTFLAGLFERWVLARFRAWRGTEAADGTEPEASVSEPESYHWQVLSVVLLGAIFVYFAAMQIVTRDNIVHLVRKQNRNSDRILDLLYGQNLILRELEGGRRAGDKRPRLFTDLSAELDVTAAFLAQPSFRSSKQALDLTAGDSKVKPADYRTVQVRLSYKAPVDGIHLAVFRWDNGRGEIVKLEAKPFPSKSKFGRRHPVVSSMATRDLRPGHYSVQVLIDGALMGRQSFEIVGK